MRVYRAGVEAPAAQGTQEARREEEEKVDAKPMSHVQDEPSVTGDASCGCSDLASDHPASNHLKPMLHVQDEPSVTGDASCGFRLGVRSPGVKSPEADVAGA